VLKDVEDGAFVTGYPAAPHREWLRTNAALKRLQRLLQRVRELERRLDLLEGNETKEES